MVSGFGLTDFASPTYENYCKAPVVMPAHPLLAQRAFPIQSHLDLEAAKQTIAITINGKVSTGTIIYITLSVLDRDNFHEKGCGNHLPY